MLVDSVKASDIALSLKTRTEYHPFPRACEREQWDKLPNEAKWFYKNAANALKNCDWPELKAVRYMDFVRNGDRSRYEHSYFLRRDMLYSLMMGECLTGSGDYLDDIANGVWTICEETSWVIPAHNNHLTGDALNALPDFDAQPYIDLFAAETASLLGWVYYMLGDELDGVTPLIKRRIEFELDRRIFKPFLSDAYFPWSGLNGGFINNWNPWINSNLIAATLCVCADDAVRVAMIDKTARSLDCFIDSYKPDGGCDEGPSYFNEAGAALFDALEELYGATDGRVNIFGDEKIRNMGRYIMYMHIAGKRHVNFADASPDVDANCMLLMRYGKACGCDELTEYARGLQAAGSATPVYRINRYNIFRNIADVMMYSPSLVQGARTIEPLQHYLPGIEVLTARSAADTTKGLFLAAKGGHNGESHNHNDVGNYIIYVNGGAAICDAGVETYSRKTFSEERYTIWAMQSRYHNTAIINGCDQLPGIEYAASDVTCGEGDNPALNMDMAGAYPKEAGVQKYARTICLDRAANCVTVHDAVKASGGAISLELPVLCANEPELAEGCITIAAGGQSLRLKYDGTKFTASVESIALTDAKLHSEWKRPALYRVLLRCNEKIASDEFELIYELA